MSKHLVGVTTSRRSGWLLWVFAALSLRLQGLEAVRITAPFKKEKFDHLDGLIVGGGDDIGATLYDALPAPDVRIDTERDDLEFAALEMLWERDMPILGICRGAQMLNVYRGGTLHQDIYEAFAGMPRLRTPLPRKLVGLVDGSRLHRIVNEDEIVVNALHHQSVNRLGDGMTVAATDEYNIVQAIEFQGHAFRVGVQWHPEFLFYRSTHRQLFAAFAGEARGNATIDAPTQSAVRAAKP